jgi:hypothetical protein
MGNFFGDLAAGAANAVTGGLIQREFDRSAAHDAATTNIALWRMQNAYNTPLRQRQRMEAAGYNPALFYGNGTPGNATSPPSAPGMRPQTKIGNPLEGAYDLQMRKAQIDNIQADTANKIASNPLIEQKVGTEWERSRLTNEQATQLRSKREANIDVANLNAGILRLTAENMPEKQKLLIEDLRQSIELKKKAGQRIDVQNMLDSFEIQLNNAGLTKSDPIYGRVLKILYDSIQQ